MLSQRRAVQRVLSVLDGLVGVLARHGFAGVARPAVPASPPAHPQAGRWRPRLRHRHHQSHRCGGLSSRVHSRSSTRVVERRGAPVRCRLEAAGLERLVEIAVERTERPAGVQEELRLRKRRRVGRRTLRRTAAPALEPDPAAAEVTDPAADVTVPAALELDLHPETRPSRGSGISRAVHRRRALRSFTREVSKRRPGNSRGRAGPGMEGRGLAAPDS